jgi:EAL domain-containing protein (putative c-di-GMP-specific phosphodiesterase class I)
MTTARPIAKEDRDRHVALSFCWGDLLFEIDPDFKVAYAAGPTHVFLGREPDELRGLPFRSIVHPADAPLARQMLRRMAQNGRIDNESVRIQTPRGMAMAMTAAGYRLEESGNLYIALRMGGPKSANAAVGTGGELHDGTSFARLAAERVKALQEDGEQAEVTVVAIPGMGGVARGLDPARRDQMMQRVTTVLRAESMGGDAAAQVAEESFGLLHQSGADVDGIARKLEQAVREVAPEATDLGVQSTTMAMTEVAQMEAEDLAGGLRQALTRLADSVVSAQPMPDISSLMQASMRDVGALRQMVATGEFEAVVHPVIDAYTGELHHFEALCRFKGEPITRRAIAMAEQSGRIRDLDLAMLRKVIAALDKFPRNSDRGRFSLNVSAVSISQHSFLQGLYTILKDHLWTQGKLAFEIAGTSRLPDLAACTNFINTVRKWGYGVSLDDFGAGPSAFNLLASVEVDMVKIDGAAIATAQAGTKGRAFLSSLTDLCRRLGVESVAEAIDSEETLKFARDCGFDCVQGFLFGRPSANPADFLKPADTRLFRPGAKRPAQAQLATRVGY